MIHIQSIMVPVDFSEPSKKAVTYGLSLASEFRARLILAHIARFDKAAYENAKVGLLELIPMEFRNEHIYEIIVKSGDVKEEIMGIVRDKNVDLVVMGTHARPYFERMLLGSVTERMLRKLPAPILTVSPTAGSARLNNILYATDLGDGSEEGLKFSIRLARGLAANLTVVHVTQAIEHVFIGAEVATYLPVEADAVREQILEKLNRSVALVSDGSVPIKTILAEGSPYQMINQIAQTQKADLIVMNLQSKGRLERALLGSTAERVIRTATVPVLSLPLPATYSARWAAA